MEHQHILIYHIGSLGDTLIAIPAFKAIREHFRGAKITLLSDHQHERQLIQPRDILQGTGLVDKFITYTVYRKKGAVFKQLKEYIKLSHLIRRYRFDGMIYLIRGRKNVWLVWRDLFFFRFSGIKKCYGHKINSGELVGSEHNLNGLHITDQILARLRMFGIAVPESGKADLSFPITQEDRIGFESWKNSLPDDGNRKWIAIGCFSKMPVKRWPLDRYDAVVSELIRFYDIWPVIFGGQEDRQEAEKLVHSWGRGYVAAGVLTVRQGIAAMQRCCLYLGNDTGIMHMAVAAGIPCVAIFSSRNYPGEWDPYGNEHIVVRKSIDCEGCRLEKCDRGEMICINMITVEEVFNAVSKLMENIIVRKGEG